MIGSAIPIPSFNNKDKCLCHQASLYIRIYDPPTRHERHDGGGPDGDVLGAPEHDVDEAAHEGGVEAVLRLQARHQRVGDTWQVECLAQRAKGGRNSEWFDVSRLYRKIAPFQAHQIAK